VPGFIDARAADGHKDATVYSDRENLAGVFGALGLRRPRLHIATLDDYPWTPHELAAEIFDVYGLTIDPGWIWAIQCFAADPAQGTPWDTSLVYGERDYWDPQK
jgi:hypothetical protein